MSALPFAALGMLCPILVLGVFMTVVVLIVRAATRARVQSVVGGASRTVGATAELGVDGFWILSNAFPPSSIIHYYFWSDGARYDAQVPCQPGPDGRQFIYTGMRPEQVALVRVVQPSGDGGSDLLIPGIIAADAILSSSATDSASPPAPPSFPPAY